MGELLSANLERFLRHDTCEHHASACVARVVENMWPPQMNVPSVTQFCYLAWYLLNDNWAKARVLMLDELDKPEAEMDDKVAAMLKREGGAMDLLSVEKLAEILIESRNLNKPDKPNSNRWGTQADMIDFVFRFSPLLAVIFDEIREFGGAGGAVAGSIEASQAVLQTVIHQAATGRGSYLKVPLSNAAAYLALPRTWGLTTRGAAVGGGHAGYQIYPCKNGRVAVAALEPHFAARLGLAAGLASNLDMTLDATQTAIGAWLRGQTRLQLDKLARTKDIPLHTMA